MRLKIKTTYFMYHKASIGIEYRFLFATNYFTKCWR